MSPYGHDPIRGRPLEVEFLGFRSDTYTLQQHGWQISESGDPRPYDRGDEWYISIRHPEHRASGMSRPLRYSRMHHDEQFRYQRVVMDIGLPYMMREHRQMDFRPADATPRYMEVSHPRDLYNQPYFQPIQQDSKEIILKRASMEEIMEIALSKQEPEQERIREEMQRNKRLSELRQGGEEKARLIMVA